VKQSSLPSRASTRSQTATKIFSEDRPLHVDVNREDRAFALGNDRCMARAAEFPDRGRRIVRRCVSQREEEFFRTKSPTRVFNDESASMRFAPDADAGVERHAQRPLMPQTVTRKTNTTAG
jgi:hypothetical protein